MRTFIFLILLAVGMVDETHASSLRQHSVRGLVTSVDPKRGIVTITAGDKESPTEFVVEENRTRVRRNGAPAVLDDLPVGQSIRVYYAQEAGKAVAYEINWQTSQAPGPGRTP